MNNTQSIEKDSKLLLLILSISYALYIVVAFDFITLYEIFVDLALFATLVGSIVYIFKVVIASAKTKHLPKKSTILITCAVAFCYFLTFGNRNGMFEGGKILDAAFLDDRSRIDIALYENGKYIIFSNWMFGEERFEGKYKLEGDTIKFLTTPVIDNDFIAQEAIIDRKEKKIYFRKNIDGNYIKDFYYFQIGF
ncbi:hypothetical protein H9Q13_03390 [Pontibacter sp. JH31]|uniref:Uncharacterized protein n=1 Tax=Pontibacter aquaedesilientis TaxID=2766980 RepID=A0ABR7XD20_9BACT|nr:hypothetical protein [Pontibacter aquaedesilientis]MBD1396198.1 hypothetical protein [Pontibacter aquaedesilientis]